MTPPAGGWAGFTRPGRRGAGPGQAFAYYRKGAEREDLNSLCRLARCYALGIGTRKDREKASALAQEILSRDWEESGELEDYGARAELEALRALWKELEPEKP